MFKNVEIDGSLTEFVTKMEAKGLTLVKQAETNAVMKGSFMGRSDVQFIISATPVSKIVHRVFVMLPKHTNDWTILKNEYNYCEESYTQKYGAPQKSIKKFKSPYYEGDSYEISAVRLNKVTYINVWNVDNGEIMIFLTTDCQVCIAYSDSHNSAIASEEEKSNVIDEI